MKIALLAGVLALTGCAPAYERLASQKPDATYEKLVITTTGTVGTNQTPIFIKRFEDQGQLALCGYMLPGGTANFRDLIAGQTASRDSRFILNSQVVGDLSFIVSTAVTFDGLGATAGCVRTQTPWSDRLLRAPYRLTFEKARMQS
jgi:hypothetical protein